LKISDVLYGTNIITDAKIRYFEWSKDSVIEVPNGVLRVCLIYIIIKKIRL
jgi:hypothetical protein